MNTIPRNMMVKRSSSVMVSGEADWLPELLQIGAAGPDFKMRVKETPGIVSTNSLTIDLDFRKEGTYGSQVQ